jgi:hypothetical protein
MGRDVISCLTRLIHPLFCQNLSFCCHRSVIVGTSVNGPLAGGSAHGYYVRQLSLPDLILSKVLAYHFIIYGAN